jgi:hypothetical protein
MFRRTLGARVVQKLNLQATPIQIRTITIPFAALSRFEARLESCGYELYEQSAPARPYPNYFIKGA